MDGDGDGGGGNGSEFTAHMMWGRSWRQEARRCGRCKDSTREGTTLSGNRRWVNKVGSRDGRGRGENRVSMVTFLLLGAGAGEADGRSFDNLPNSDTVPLLELVGG